MSNSSLVSVIMPNFNHARYLADSVEAVLSQSYNHLELIIIDDCSNDESPEIIETFRRKDKRVIPIYNSMNLGASGSRNKALKTCRGDYIAFCDADDIWEKEKTKLQIERLQSENEYDVVFCDSIIINEKGVSTGERFSSQHVKMKDVGGNIFHELCLSNYINTATVMFRKKCLDQVGLFDENIKYIEDWLYWTMLARHFRFLYVDTPLVRYRVHPNSSNKDRIGLKKQRIKVCRIIIDRFLDLPTEIKSTVYYNIAMDYASLGEKRSAFRNFMISFRYKKTNFKSLMRIFGLPFLKERVSP